jgi:HD-GYP domain-containing protein (c-di-GMP phosphodiesterase class II)
MGTPQASTMALPPTSRWAQPVLATATGVAAAGADQALRGEAPVAEWWIDIPLAGLVACAVWLVLRSEGRDPEPRALDEARERAQAIDAVVAGVNRALEQAQAGRRLEQAAETGVEAMAAAVDMRDTYTGEHSDAVVELAVKVGERLRLPDDAMADLEFAARLHDVGKIGIPDAVLLKAGPLDGDEWAVMRQHPDWGAQMLARVPGLRRVARIVRHAHERWDGEGYPDALHSDSIPIESRIIFACDAYHAMTSDRPYRNALRPWIAVSELREGAGSQFDADVVDALVAILRTERAGAPFLFRQAATRAA